MCSSNFQRLVLLETGMNELNQLTYYFLNQFFQPAIYVTSLAAVEVLRARDGGQQIIDSVDVTCGLSLGEYTALAFAKAYR